MANTLYRKARRKEASEYVCSGCGFATPRWMGFCPQCRAESSLELSQSLHGSVAESRPLSEVVAQRQRRRATGLGEFDRVLGGGMVPGSVILVGGEPGVGKSTLLLQLADSVARHGQVVLASAEESGAQVALRAERLSLSGDGVSLVATSEVASIVRTASALDPVMLVVDSIQTVFCDDIEGSPGGLLQVRESASRFIEYAKRSGVAVVLVGHVTKEGSIAGPKTLEHMVDVVMYLEGEGDGGLRLLRSLKNRYGSVNQVGVFTMEDKGMVEVSDPSGVLVEGHRTGAAGTVLFPVVEGRRSMLCEIQALVVSSALPQPRRSVKGLDSARLHQLLAVLERHAGVSLAEADVHVNVVGGLRLRDPALDLPVALAVVSSVTDRPLPLTAAWGEVGLTGEVRATTHAERRAAEAGRFDPELVVKPGSNGVATVQEALAIAGLLDPRSSRGTAVP
jgi:DNA repair protein RadA/Sms